MSADQRVVAHTRVESRVADADGRVSGRAIHAVVDDHADVAVPPIAHVAGVGEIFVLIAAGIDRPDKVIRRVVEDALAFTRQAHAHIVRVRDLVVARVLIEIDPPADGGELLQGIVLGRKVQEQFAGAVEQLVDAVVVEGSAGARVASASRAVVVRGAGGRTATFQLASHRVAGRRDEVRETGGCRRVDARAGVVPCNDAVEVENLVLVVAVGPGGAQPHLDLFGRRHDRIRQDRPGQRIGGVLTNHGLRAVRDSKLAALDDVAQSFHLALRQRHGS